MTIARKYLIDTTETCFYHCMSRCIGQRFLLRKNGNQANSRRAWIESWLLFLADTFAIDVLSYSIMENHTHTVLHINRPLADSWTASEVLTRRAQLGRIPKICEKYIDHQRRNQLEEIELALIFELVQKYRHELSDISKFMQRLNSYIAYKANKEDGRKGHFWEGRFKSQALMNEEAILACMTYVDLNPHRAGIASNLQDASFTSICHRLSASKNLEKTRMLPFRKITWLDFLPNVCNLGLSSYVETLNRMTNSAETSDLEKGFTEFVDDEKSWQTVVLDLKSHINLEAEDIELVSKFEERALRMNNDARNRHADLTSRILSELRDIRYQSGKKRHAT